MALVGSDDTIAIAAMVVGAVAFSYHAENWKIGKIFSSVLIAMGLGMLLSNSSIMPLSAAIYDDIIDYLVPLALPLFLFEANWRRIIVEAGRLLMLFMAGALGVVMGAIIAVWLVDIGANASGWAGVLSASYIGGSANFVAVSTALDLPSGETAVAVAADAIMGLIFLMVLVFLPSVRLYQNWLPAKAGGQATGANPDQSSANVGSSITKKKFYGAALGLAVSAVIFVLAKFIVNLLDIQNTHLLTVTVLALLFTNLLPGFAAKLRPAYTVGVLFMLAFFFVIGATANVTDFLQNGLQFAFFIFIIIVLHLICILGAARILRFGFDEAVIASCACAVGPAVAAGLAANKGWSALVTPGILLGVFGYAIANFLGVFLAHLLG